MPPREPPVPGRILGLLLFAAVVGVALWFALSDAGPRAAPRTSSPTIAADPGRSTARDGASALLKAEAERRSDVLLTIRAPVARVLRDDREGSPHQRFVVEVADSVTVLVAHNLELAPRVPLAVGDTVTVRGEYEWSERGGVLHWTHDDPRGRHPAGFVELEGRRYE